LAAQQAVDEQVVVWRRQITVRLAEVNGELEAAVRAATVPEAQVRDEAAALSLIYEPVRRQLERDAVTYGETRTLLSQMTTCDMDAREQLCELRERYTATLPPQERHVTWQALYAQPIQIESLADLDRFVGELRNTLAGYLAAEDITRLVIQ
jgi:hypothetical protein